MRGKWGTFILASLAGIAVLAMILPAGDADAVFACLKLKEPQECGGAGCNMIPTSLRVVSDELAPFGQSGWWPGGKCGWKFCSTLVCSCGEPLTSGSCTGEDPCG